MHSAIAAVIFAAALMTVVVRPSCLSEAWSASAGAVLMLVTGGVDLMAMRAGGRDRLPLGPKSLGPVAHYIADHSSCPVLLIR